MLKINDFVIFPVFFSLTCGEKMASTSTPKLPSDPAKTCPYPDIIMSLVDWNSITSHSGITFLDSATTDTRGYTRVGNNIRKYVIGDDLFTLDPYDGSVLPCGLPECSCVKVYLVDPLYVVPEGKTPFTLCICPFARKCLGYLAFGRAGDDYWALKVVVLRPEAPDCFRTGVPRTRVGERHPESESGTSVGSDSNEEGSPIGEGTEIIDGTLEKEYPDDPLNVCFARQSKAVFEIVVLLRVRKLVPAPSVSLTQLNLSALSLSESTEKAVQCVFYGRLKAFNNRPGFMFRFNSFNPATMDFY